MAGQNQAAIPLLSQGNLAENSSFRRSKVGSQSTLVRIPAASGGETRGHVTTQELEPPANPSRFTGGDPRRQETEAAAC